MKILNFSESIVSFLLTVHILWEYQNPLFVYCEEEIQSVSVFRKFCVETSLEKKIIHQENDLEIAWPVHKATKR